mgnify:CR=1 FL=1
MKIYISGAITGVKEYEKNFERGQNTLLEQGHRLDNIYNPVWFCRGIPKGSKWETYMRTCVSILPFCDKIYMLKGWENSKGATEEHRIAKMLGLEVVYESV